MKKAIADNLFAPPMTFTEGLHLAKRAGYEGVELWMGFGSWFQPKTTSADRLTLRHQIHDAGLAVSSIANCLAWTTNVSDRDPAVRRVALEHIERQLETAEILQTDAILVIAGIVTEEIPYNEVYVRSLESLRALANQARRARVRIGVENRNSETRFLLSPHEFSTFLDEVGSPWVGAHLDVGTIHDAGFPEQWIEILGRRITRIHVKDVMRGRGRAGGQSVVSRIPAIRGSC
jgi:L-ribulose-5-phosphate 3-epimerase